MVAAISSTNCTTAPVASWTSSASTIATVSSSGLVTGVSTGSAIVTASAGSASGTALITVSPPPVATVNVTLGSASLAIGGSTAATAVALSATNVVLTGRTTAWSSSNSLVASVSQTGDVSAVAGGTASIRATVDGVVGQATITVLPSLGVASVAPSDGASSASIESVVRITFSAAIDPTTVTASSIVLSKAGTSVSATRTVSGTVVTLTPSDLLTEFSSAYTVLVTTAVKSTAGQSLAANGGSSYTTVFWDPDYYYRLTNLFSGPSKSLDTYSDSKTCFMGDTGGFSGQFWYFIPRDATYYSMQNAFGGPTAGLEGADTGTPCFLVVDGTLPNSVTFTGMLWKPVAVPGIGGAYYLQPGSSQTKSLGTVSLVPQLVPTPPTPTGGASVNWTFTRIGHR